MIKVTGHRGAAELAPENTLAGFRKALSLGCHSVELDVQLTRDGNLAVIHDEAIDHTTDGHGPVESFTMAELKRFDAGGGERIPELGEVLALFEHTDMGIQIELKGAGTAAATVQLVRKWAMESRVTFTSFFHRRVLEAGLLLPEATTGILIDCNPIDPLHMMEAARADNLHVNHVHIDSELVGIVHNAGKTIVAWGRVVELNVINRMIDLGVDVVGSDRPDLVLEQITARKQA